MEEEKQKPKKDRKVFKAVLITIGIMITLLALMFLVFSFLQLNYNQGVQDGVQLLYSEIVNNVGRCQTYPIQIQNQTVNLILVECISQNAEGANNG